MAYLVHAQFEAVKAQVLADVDYSSCGVDSKERLSRIVACYLVPHLTLQTKPHTLLMTVSIVESIIMLNSHPLFQTSRTTEQNEVHFQ